MILSDLEWHSKIYNDAKRRVASATEELLVKFGILQMVIFGWKYTIYEVMNLCDIIWLKMLICISAIVVQ